MLRERKKVPITEFDLNSEVVEAFVRVLDKRKLTVEGFFRAVNVGGQEEIWVEKFKDIMIQMGMFGKDEGKIGRLIKLFDENFSGDISLEEIQKTVLAYKVRTEREEEENKSKLSVEQISLIKVWEQIERRQIRPNEIFNSIDVDHNL